MHRDAPGPGDPPPVRPARYRDARAIGECHAEARRIGFTWLFAEDFLARAVADRRVHTGSNLVALLVGDGEAVLADGSILLVAESAEGIVGFAHGGECAESPGVQETYALYVLPGSWGRGSATSLWEATLARLRPRTHRPVVLWTIEGAARARRFYERNGWWRTGGAKLHDFGDRRAARLIQYAGR